MSFQVITSNYTNPFINLAIEDDLLKSIAPNEKILFLYVNEPSIIYGRFQNPWIECKVSKAIEDNIHLVRRQSGGGCVYHDLNNLNFSFIYPERDFNKNLNNEIIIDALGTFGGVKAYASGRSDLLIDSDNGPLKFSGSAFKQKKDRSFHHGTLLIKSDLAKLNEYLRPKDFGLVSSKSIKSNPATVVNLSSLDRSITKESLTQALAKSASKKFDHRPEFKTIDNFYESDYFHELKSWKWIWGETPEFNLGIMQCMINIRKGRIIEIKRDGVAAHKELIDLELKMETLEDLAVTSDEALQIVKHLKQLVS